MSRRQSFLYGGLFIAGGIACWFFPLFHIRPLGEERSTTGHQSGAPDEPAPANPADFVKSFWAGPLRAGEGATDVITLWKAFDANATNARTEYGHQAGLGGAWYFCVRGEGVVETVEKKQAILAVAGSSRHVRLDLGLVVDNTVREALGVKASSFANSQDFNAVSSELNRRVEQEVIPPNRPLLTPGAEVEFVGCAKIAGLSDLDLIRLIPVRLTIAVNEGATGADDGGPAP